MSGRFRPWFDRWVLAGEYRATDVAIFRILYGSMAVTLLPDFPWLSDYPDAFYNPPPGPFALLDGFPPSWVLWSLQILSCLGAVGIFFGYHTKTASITYSLALIVGEGFVFSLGKIDHTILINSVPLVMAFSDWGRRYSLDALRHPERVSHEPQQQWPLRALAMFLAIAFEMAAVMKIAGGWLMPHNQATYGFLASEHFANSRRSWLATVSVETYVPGLWKLADIATVLLEGGLVVALFLSWRAWRIAVALLCVFHVAVLLTMNITYWQGWVYGAFVPWSRLPWWGTWKPPTAWRNAMAHFGPSLALLSSGGILCVSTSIPLNQGLIKSVLVFIAGAIAIWYLGRLARMSWISRRAPGSARSVARRTGSG